MSATNIDVAYDDSNAPADEAPALDVDPGEAAAAVCTMAGILKGEPPRMHTADVRRAANLHAELDRLAMRVVSGEDVPGPSVPSMAYSTALNALSAGINDDMLSAMAGAYPDGGVAMGLMGVTARLYDFLVARIPRVIYASQTKTVNLDPPKTDWFEFQDLMSLLLDPLGIFGMISDGSLVPTQVEAFGAVYPSLLQQIRLAVDGAITAKLAQVKSFELPAHAEFGVAVLRDAPVDAVLYQDGYSEQSAKRDVTPSPSQAKSPLAAESRSTTERALYDLAK